MPLGSRSPRQRVAIAASQPGRADLGNENTSHGAEAAITPRMGLVCFVFGAARVSPGGRLPGPVLMRLLADLGLSGSAARSLLLRMRQQGLLDSTHVGREAHYRLSPVLDAAQSRLAEQLTGHRPAWTGSFHAVLYEVPESHRDFRDRLRRTAGLLGYVTLRPGLVIATSDRWDQLTALLPPPAHARVLAAKLSFSTDDSRRLATEVWHLHALAARYRTAIAGAQARTAAAERDRPAGPAAFQAFAAAALPLYTVAADDPDLPTALLPPDWPGHDLAAATTRSLQVFFPLLQNYLPTALGQNETQPTQAAARQTAARQTDRPRDASGAHRRHQPR